jgi:hypothetical protein
VLLPVMLLDSGFTSLMDDGAPVARWSRSEISG